MELQGESSRRLRYPSALLQSDLVHRGLLGGHSEALRRGFANAFGRARTEQERKGKKVRLDGAADDPGSRR
jgi:hypothetical protein